MGGQNLFFKHVAIGGGAGGGDLQLPRSMQQQQQQQEATPLNPSLPPFLDPAKQQQITGLKRDRGSGGGQHDRSSSPSSLLPSSSSSTTYPLSGSYGSLDPTHLLAASSTSSFLSSIPPSILQEYCSSSSSSPFSYHFHGSPMGGKGTIEGEREGGKEGEKKGLAVEKGRKAKKARL